MLTSKSVCEMVGLLCNREHRSPCLHAPICVVLVPRERRVETSPNTTFCHHRSGKTATTRGARERESERESERKVSECSTWIDFQFDPIRFDSGKHPTNTHAHTKKDLSNDALVLSYLEVERAVHAVLLRPEDARQVFRHDMMMRDEFLVRGKFGQ